MRLISVSLGNYNPVRCAATFWIALTILSDPLFFLAGSVVPLPVSVSIFQHFPSQSPFFKKLSARSVWRVILPPLFFWAGKHFSFPAVKKRGLFLYLPPLEIIPLSTGYFLNLGNFSLAFFLIPLKVRFLCLSVLLEGPHLDRIWNLVFSLFPDCDPEQLPLVIYALSAASPSSSGFLFQIFVPRVFS